MAPSPPTTPPDRSTAKHKQETPGAMAPPSTIARTHLTATHKQETPGAMAPPSTIARTPLTTTLQQETSPTTATRITTTLTGCAATQNQFTSDVSASLTTAASAGSFVMQHQTAPRTAGSSSISQGELSEGELSDGEILENEVTDDNSDSPRAKRPRTGNSIMDLSDECPRFAPMPASSAEAQQIEQTHNEATGNVADSPTSHESEHDNTLLQHDARLRPGPRFRVGNIIYGTQIEPLVNKDYEGSTDAVKINGQWYIKKKRFMLIGAFIGKDPVTHQMTTFGETESSKLRNKRITDDSLGSRYQLADYVQVIADYHPSQTPIAREPLCYKKGRTQLHWNSRGAPPEQISFVSLINTSTFPVGNVDMSYRGSLSEDSLAKFLTMRTALQTKLSEGTARALKRKREDGDRSHAVAPRSISSVKQLSAHGSDRARQEEPRDWSTSDVPRPPRNQHYERMMPPPKRKECEDMYSRTAPAPAPSPAAPSCGLTHQMHSMGHDAQHPTPSPITSAQPAVIDQNPTVIHSQPSLQSSGNAKDQQKPSKTKRKKAPLQCTWEGCGKMGHTEEQCWVKDPSKKAKKKSSTPLATSGEDQSSMFLGEQHIINNNFHVDRLQGNINSGHRQPHDHRHDPPPQRDPRSRSHYGHDYEPQEYSRHRPEPRGYFHQDSQPQDYEPQEYPRHRPEPRGYFHQDSRPQDYSRHRYESQGYDRYETRSQDFSHHDRRSQDYYDPRGAYDYYNRQH